MISTEFFKNLFSLIWKIFLVVIIAVGVYCSVMLYNNITAESQVFGEINEHDPWEDFNIYDCDLSDAIFYQTSSGYEYTTTIPVSQSFNGNTTKYNVLVNNTPCVNEVSSGGVLTAQNVINYYSIDGENILQTVLNIELRFYQSNIEITITNANNSQQQSYFLEYLNFNGLHLKIIEAQYTIQTPETENYTVTFLDEDGATVIAVQTYNKGAELIAPTAPTKEGYTFAGWAPTLPKYVTENLVFFATYAVAYENILDSPVVLTGNDSYIAEGVIGYQYEIKAELYYDNALYRNFTIRTTKTEASSSVDNVYRASGRNSFTFTDANYYNVTASMSIGAGTIFYDYETYEPRGLSIGLSVSQVTVDDGFSIMQFLRKFSLRITSISAY